MCTHFALCQRLLDFSDQIVRYADLSVHVQGSDGPCQCSRSQIALDVNQ